MKNDDKVKIWKDKIFKNFAGPNGFNGERLLKLDRQEKIIESILLKKINGFIYIMDAFFDFLIETFENTSKNNKINWSKYGKIFISIQIINFWRLRSSYIIYNKGYYVDALSLLRGIYENILMIESLQKGVIEVDEVFSKLKIEDSKELSEREIEKSIRKYDYETNKKIKRHFINKESGLTDKTIKSLKIFERVLNNSVHKSKVNFFIYYDDFSKGKKGIPIFPEYNEVLAGTYTNMCVVVSWMFLKTLPHFLVNREDFEESWNNKYNVLNDSFREDVENFPNNNIIGKAIIELVDEKFIVK